MCWALQAAEFARLASNETVRNDVYRRYRKILLPGQLATDGSFPKELARTKPYSYSIFNFDVMAALCQSLKGLTPDPPAFQDADGRGLRKAAEFLYPYLKDKASGSGRRTLSTSTLCLSVHRACSSRASPFTSRDTLISGRL